MQCSSVRCAAVGCQKWWDILIRVEGKQKVGCHKSEGHGKNGNLRDHLWTCNNMQIWLQALKAWGLDPD